MTAEEIINYIKASRQEDYRDQENWEVLDDMGLSDFYKEILGEIVLKAPIPEPEYWDYDMYCVWYFKDHDVYIGGSVDRGSYDIGYKLGVWDLKEVFPKKVEITIYE